MDLFLIVVGVFFAAIVVGVKDLFFSSFSYIKFVFESFKTFMFNKSSMYPETKENVNYELTDKALNIIDDIVDEICLNVNTKSSDVIDALEIKLNDIIKENLYYAKNEVSDKNWIVVIHEKITNALFEMNLAMQNDILDLNDVIKGKISQLLECNMVVNIDDEKVEINENTVITDPSKKQFSELESVFMPKATVEEKTPLNELEQAITEIKHIETVNEKLPSKQVKSTKKKTAKKAMQVVIEKKKAKKATTIKNKTTKKVAKKTTNKKK